MYSGSILQAIFVVHLYSIQQYHTVYINTQSVMYIITVLYSEDMDIHTVMAAIHTTFNIITNKNIECNIQGTPFT